VLIVLDSRSEEPLYQQIADQIRTAILSGAVGPGESLPSIRQLAAELVTSVITTKRAYQELEADGLIQTRQGRGTFVADLPEGRISSLRSVEIERRLLETIQQAFRLGLSPERLMHIFHSAMTKEANHSE
jgi:GntR family transcriptional regulator